MATTKYVGMLLSLFFHVHRRTDWTPVFDPQVGTHMTVLEDIGWGIADG